MPDYGHTLTFGTFLTPRNDRPDIVLDLARLTERAGLDLATFQDHPYQSRFLDTWTLMSYVAAQTRRISVAPNVINLPLRPPAVLARSAASLDLLSEGRFELGLGAGAFWDAIVAMGGRRLSPGESLTALSEAIDIIRGVWEGDRRGGLRLAGEHYQVSGMTRGPSPAHDIAIWLGAYKPRMLRLIGEKADGWLPSLGYLTLEQIPESNQIIDDAALSAGRQPRAIRRLLNINGSFANRGQGFLNGPAAQWAEELAELALTHGIGTFILGGDDPTAIQLFGEEVAPAVRELVAAERGPTPPGGSGRDFAPVEAGSGAGAGAGTGRSAQIDYAAVPDSLQTNAYAPGDRGYDRVRSTYMRAANPGLVLMAESPAQVAEAVAFARQQPVPLSVRSGGHGIHGLSTNDGGIVIDVSRLNEIAILDESRKLVRAGAGATWGKIAQRLAPLGWAMSSGDYGDVGVGGLATAGGVGWLVREHGLMIDHITAAEIVLADGRILRADHEQHPDLLWAIRGAGANFGVVTAIEFEAYETENVIFAVISLDATDTAGVLQQWGSYMEDAPRELTSFINLTPAHRAQRQPVAQILAVFANDDIPAATAALEPMLTWAPVLEQQAQIVPYPALISPFDSLHNGQQPVRPRSGLIERMTPETAAALASLLESRYVYYLQLRSLGGAVNDVSPEETAYVHRSQNLFVSAIGDRDRRYLDPLWERLAPHLNGLYINFETDTRLDRVREAYPSPVFERLQRLKRTYDPDNVFNQNFNIPPAAVEAATG